MSRTVLYEQDDHRNLLLAAVSAGEGVDTNQHLIIDGHEALLLDPGGAKLYSRVATLVSRERERYEAELKYVFLSHQDPDVVASVNGWLMTTGATGLISTLWKRFMPHFGCDKLVYSRLEGVPDEGMVIRLGSRELVLLPAHFLHSVGNLHLYDPTSKVLYTGDLGVSLGEDGREVEDFDAHVSHMRGFHERYMTNTGALRGWLKMARTLDVEIVAPQHGALFRGRPMVLRLFDWLETLECGYDRMKDVYRVPTGFAAPR
ncbi:MAG: MBL fold metallo-hydrolase [Myxococcota bacterium]